MGKNYDTKCRLFNRQNTKCFKRLIDDISWGREYKNTYAESAYQLFLTTFNSVFHSSFPLVKPHEKVAKKFWKPWFTAGLYKSSKKVNKSYKKFLTNPTPLNFKKL